MRLKPGDSLGASPIVTAPTAAPSQSGAEISSLPAANSGLFPEIAAAAAGPEDMQLACA